MSMQQNVYPTPTFQQNVIGTSHVSEVNQWDNIANYTSPVSGAMYVTTSTSTWAHTVPSFMPWVPESTSTTCSTSSSSSSNSIVRFTAPFHPDPCTSQTATSWELLNNLCTSNNANVHLKRKNYIEESELPHKTLVTEEKMAARMQNLHISKHYVVPDDDDESCSSSVGTFGEVEERLNTMQQLEAMLSSNNTEQNGIYKGSLILAPEIKNLIEPEKLFAKTFINQVERPTMAVVLWKPPHGSVSKITNNLLDEKQKGSDSQNNLIITSSKATNSLPISTLQRQIASSNINSVFNPADISLPDEDYDFDMEA